MQDSLGELVPGRWQEMTQATRRHTTDKPKVKAGITEATRPPEEEQARTWNDSRPSWQWLESWHYITGFVQSKWGYKGIHSGCQLSWDVIALSSITPNIFTSDDIATTLPISPCLRQALTYAGLVY